MVRKEESSSEYLIRNLSPSDIAAIPEFIQSNSNMKPHGKDVYSLLSISFSDTCLVVEREKQIGGICFGFVSAGHPDVFFLWYLCLAPKLRRLDLISRLCGTMLGKAQERGCTRLQFTLYDGSSEEGRLLNFAKWYLGRIFTREHFLTTTNESGETTTESLYEFPIPTTLREIRID